MDKSTLLDTAQKLGLSGAALNPGDLERMTDPNFSLSLSGDALITRVIPQATHTEQEYEDSFSNTSSHKNHRDDDDEWENEGSDGELDSATRTLGRTRTNKRKPFLEAEEFDAHSDSISLSLPESFYDDYGTSTPNEDDISDEDEAVNSSSSFLDEVVTFKSSTEEFLPTSIKHNHREYSKRKQQQQPRASASSVPPRGMIAQMQQQITSLLENSRNLEDKLGQERLSKATSLAEAENLRIANEQSFNLSLHELEEKNQRLTMQLDQQQNVFKDLDISESSYEELKQTPKQDLSLREFICMEIYQDRQKSKQKISSLRLEVERLKESRMDSTDQMESMRREHQRILTMCQQKEEMLLLQGNSTESHVQELRKRLEISENKCMEMEPKSREYEVARDRLIKTEIEIQSLKEQASVHVEALKNASSAERSAKSRSSDLEHQVSYLEMDKKYLTNEISKANLRAEKADQHVDFLTSKMRELENYREELSVELSLSRQTSTSAYEEKLSIEMIKQREEMTKELGNIQRTLCDTHQRECDVLREARDAALSETERSHQKQLELSVELERCKKEFTQTTIAQEHKNAELKSELKLREFELSKLTVLHEVKLAELNEFVRKTSLLEKQVQVHQSEFRRLETSSDDATELLEKQIKELQEQLSLYQDLESELDAAAILQEEEGVMAPIGLGGRHNNHRRKQVAALSRKLLSVENNLIQKDKLLTDANQELVQAKQHAQLLNEQLSVVNQPTRFMVKEFEKYQKEVKRLDSELISANEQALILKEKAEVEMKVRIEVEKDLKSLMKCKDEIKDLKRMIDAFQKTPNSPHVTYHGTTQSPHRPPRSQPVLQGYGFGVADGPSHTSSPGFHKRSSPGRKEN